LRRVVARRASRSRSWARGVTSGVMPRAQVEAARAGGISRR
jgi:hypothetical protein